MAVAEVLQASWPVLLVAGTGLVAWGRTSSRIDRVEDEVKLKASKEIVEHIERRLDSMDQKLDRLIERGAA